MTEDHCRLPLDWAVLNVAAHQAYPDAAAVGGRVENGATEMVMDWASFLVVQAPFVAPIASAAPIGSGPAERISGAVSVTYKADALRSIEGFAGHGRDGRPPPAPAGRSRAAP